MSITNNRLTHFGGFLNKIAINRGLMTFVTNNRIFPTLFSGYFE